jgi:hypothetical protein
MRIEWTAIALATCLLQSLPAMAAVAADEAARLKADLTPFGAEKAGNKDGTIPAWTGGFKGNIPGDKPGGRRGDPFKDEKPLYTVTAKNMDQHADKLTDGLKALLKRYPDTYRLDVYPTHRTATAPQWVYDNTARNAVRGRMENNIPVGVYGGIPFPIPKTGEEVMWNHNLRYRPSSWEMLMTQYQVTGAGKVVLFNDAWLRQQMPYYFPDGSPEKFDGFFWEMNLSSNGPPMRAGESVGARTAVDDTKTQAYVYLAGQRRVRKLPNPCCDSPTTASAGMMSYDELSVFSGRTSTHDFKLVGKREMLMPYNQNRFLQAKDAEIIKGAHLDPEHVRWELHRVWVVEATLKPGGRHQAPKSLYYVDEDTWLAMLGDRWDAKGQLWKTIWGFNYVMPDVPGTIDQTFGYYDLLSGVAFLSGVMNDKPYQERATQRWPTTIFTADGLAAQGVR